jgi:hypothetical protein
VVQKDSEWYKADDGMDGLLDYLCRALPIHQWSWRHIYLHSTMLSQAVAKLIFCLVFDYLEFAPTSVIPWFHKQLVYQCPAFQ